MNRICTLIHCRVGLYFEMADHAGVSANRILSANDVGWGSEWERRTVVEGLANRPLRYSPLWAAFADALPIHGRSSAGWTARQELVIGTPTWQASEMYDRHVRPTRLGHAMLSAVRMPHLESWSAWSLVTDRGDPTQSLRHERLARYLHRQIAPIIGTKLSTWRDRTVSTLSITRRGVLQALLDGHSEPNIARRAFRSRSAVHEHVTEIYRHFNVSSRGELAAFFLRRQPAAAERRVASPLLNAWLNQSLAE